jgi:hypothetical protein
MPSFTWPAPGSRPSSRRGRDEEARRVDPTDRAGPVPDVADGAGDAVPSALRWVGMLGDVLLLENGAVDAPGLADRR